MATLALAAIAVRNGLVADDAVRLWAGASTAADGQVPIGRIVAGYPTLPFLSTTLVTWIAPQGTPAPALVAAALYALLVAFCYGAFRRAGLSRIAAIIVTPLIVLHPALLRAVIAGPADMFLAIFLLMLCLALYDLRARSGTSEVMGVGLALMALAFAHPVGAAVAFSAVPFLAFAVRPFLVASSAANVVIALVFPTLFMVGAFVYVSWVFPGNGWSFFAAPTQSLSLWTAAMARLFGNGITGIPALDASLVMAVALVIAAPMAVAMLTQIWRRRPLIMPAAVFVGTALTATAICVASGFFGEPTAIIVVAPVLATTVVIRIPIARERIAVAIVLLMVGWIGGFIALTLVDPVAINGLHAVFKPGRSARLDTIETGGAFAGREGVLADTNNAPALVLGRGDAHGILGPDSEAFVLAMLFGRVNTPFIAVPDPQSTTGVNDRLE